MTVVFICCNFPCPNEGPIWYSVFSWCCVGVNNLRVQKHSAQVTSILPISFASCIARLGGLSGRSAGAGKCISRKTWHFSSGVIAFQLSCLVMGLLGYFQVPVDHCWNWYMSIRGLSSIIFLKNCLFFHFNLHLNVLSVVWYFLSVSQGGSLGEHCRDI